MDEKKWLEGHGGRSVDELIALEGEYRIDSLVTAFEDALMAKEDRVGAGGLSEAEVAVLAIEALEREVNNGGFLQFFHNTSREYAGVIVSALELIGCQKTAVIAADAIAAMGIRPEMTSDTIQGLADDASEAVEDRLDECDQRFFAYEDDIAEVLFAFIKANRDRISLA